MNGTFVISNENLTRMETARLRQQLVAMRDELVNRSGDLDRIRKKQVDSALRKLDKGGYGICEACARPMLKARLIEKPFVRYCVSCF